MDPGATTTKKQLQMLWPSQRLTAPPLVRLASGLGLRTYREGDEEGYRRIYLKTDDFRLPALKTYLKLGYEPFLCAPDMPERWRAICTQLDWPFAPHAWPGVTT